MGISSGKETCPFGRDFSTKPALQPPYYAIRITGALFHTQGGLSINGEKVTNILLREVHAPTWNELYIGANKKKFTKLKSY